MTKVTVAVVEVTPSEQMLLEIVRRLPSERMAQVLDFARFIEAQVINGHKEDLADDTETDTERIDDARWQEQFAGSLDVLEQLANAALAEHRAGRTQMLDPDRL